MSRINYSEDEEDYPGQYALWQANCRRSIRGAEGQRVMREMEVALLALPSKRLIQNAVSLSGEVCAVGAYVAAQKAKAGGSIHDAIAALESECGDEETQRYDETDALGIEYGMPRLVAWKLVALNDIEIDSYIYVTAEGPNQEPYHPAYYSAGVRQRVPVTPEHRYQQVLAWVRSQIIAEIA